MCRAVDLHPALRLQSAARLAGKQEAVRQRDEARAALEALQQEVGSVLPVCATHN